jgi:hypothetical protein
MLDSMQPEGLHFIDWQDISFSNAALTDGNSVRELAPAAINALYEIEP